MNEPRFAHDENGTPLGLTIEPQATNRCTNNNTNPVDISGFTTTGTGSLSIINDSAELEEAGLDLICTSGQVFKAEATSASPFTVFLPGTVGNTAPKAISLYARNEGDSAEIALGGAPLSIASAEYQRFKHENLTPPVNNQRFTITVSNNSSLYFILYQLDNDATCSSVIPVNGALTTRPNDRATLNNIDLENWFSNDQGFMICRYRHHRLVDGDSYIAVMNNGGASNTVGVRIDQNSKSPRGYVRSSNAYQLSTENNDTQLESIRNIVGVRWSSRESEMISGGLRAIATMNNLPTGINQLELGARNNGISAMNGYIESIHIGSENISSHELGKKIQQAQDFVVVGAGQSLIRGHFLSQEDGTDGGKLQMRRTLGSIKKSSGTIFVNGSTGGSAANKTSDDTNYWWDLDANTRGNAFDVFYFRIDNARVRPTHILWGQGEADAHQIGLNTSAAQYKQTLEAIFADMRQTLGDLPIYIQKIGRRTGFTNIGGTQIIRDIQNQIIAENDWCLEAAEIYDLSLHDSVHLSNAGYIEAAKRNGLILAGSTGLAGATISNASRDNLNITVTIEHDGSTDFSPSTAIDGFRFFDGANEITVLNAVKIDPQTISLTLSALPNNGNAVLYYGYDSMDGLDIAQIIRDNSPNNLPLKPARVQLN